MDEWEDYSETDLSGLNAWLRDRGWDNLEVRPSSDGDELEYHGGAAEIFRDNTSLLPPDDPPEDFHEEILEKFMGGLERGQKPYEWYDVPEDVKTPELVFGTTSDPTLAGYITPSGAMLDFSGGSDERITEHHQISMAGGKHGQPGMLEFMAAGNIRMGAHERSDSAPWFHLAAPPTPAQKDQMLLVIRQLGRGAVINLQDGLGPYDEEKGKYGESPRKMERDYPAGDTSRIMRDIGAFFAPRVTEAWLRGTCKFAQVRKAYACLEPGLEPGTPMKKGGAGLTSLEDVFEEVRLQVAPDAPSRKDCVFACPTVEDARDWCKTESQIYEVELRGRTFDADAETWSNASWRLLEHTRGQDLSALPPDKRYWADKSLESAREIAEWYWKGDGGAEKPEILADEGVIVAAVQDPMTTAGWVGRHCKFAKPDRVGYHGTSWPVPEDPEYVEDAAFYDLDAGYSDLGVVYATNVEDDAEYFCSWKASPGATLVVLRGDMAYSNPYVWQGEDEIETPDGDYLELDLDDRESMFRLVQMLGHDAFIVPRNYPYGGDDVALFDEHLFNAEDARIKLPGQDWSEWMPVQDAVETFAEAHGADEKREASAWVGCHCKFAASHLDWVATAEVPPEPGTIPIPSNHFRLYTYTKFAGFGDDQNHEAANSLREVGLDIGMAKGHTYGEPDAVWASTAMPHHGKVFAEFSVADDDPRFSYGMRPDPGWKDRNIDVSFKDSIRPDEILAVHEPWHWRYRYLMENDDLVEQARKGELDDLLDEQEYGPAVQKAKAGATQEDDVEGEDDEPTMTEEREASAWVGRHRKFADLRHKCFFHAAVRAILGSGRLMKGPPGSKGETAHFWVVEDDEIVDPTASQYGKAGYPHYDEGTEVSAARNVDHVMSDPLFGSLKEEDRMAIARVAQASWVRGNCRFAKEIEEAYMTSGPAPGATHRGKKCRVCGPDGEELIGSFSPSLKGETYIHPFRAPRSKKRKKKKKEASPRGGKQGSRRTGMDWFRKLAGNELAQFVKEIGRGLRGWELGRLDKRIPNTPKKDKGLGVLADLIRSLGPMGERLEQVSQTCPSQECTNSIAHSQMALNRFKRELEDAGVKFRKGKNALGAVLEAIGKLNRIEDGTIAPAPEPRKRKKRPAAPPVYEEEDEPVSKGLSPELREKIPAALRAKLDTLPPGHPLRRQMGME
jgi:hypothetical protein